MAKKTKQELESIKSLVDFQYSRFFNALRYTEDKPYPVGDLGYCYRYLSDTTRVYQIVTAPTGKEETDFRVLMHEYGHIYLGHLDGLHEDLDRAIVSSVMNNRAGMIDYINKSCGIDYGDKLLERILDDPSLNHSLHNIAMDMEVNTKILSTEDIDEMEKDITEVLDPDGTRFKKADALEEALTEKSDEISDEQKEAVNDEIKKLRNEAMIKLILPCRYHFQDGTPFPDNLTYGEYLMLIVQNLDQFIKMLVNISNGGNGDTSEVSAQDLQNALQGNQGNGGGSQGNNDGSSGDGMSSLDNLMNSCGMGKNQGGKQNSDQTADTDSPYKNSGSGKKDGDSSDGEGNGKDHGSESRDQADKNRSDGSIYRSGSQGRSTTGGSEGTRDVSRNVDSVDMAIDVVMQNYKSKVITRIDKKDMVYLWNRGINRTVIAPAYRHKIQTDYDPKFVFMIDISGSMDTHLIDRILNTISAKMKKINSNLTYDIITWSTHLGEHLKDIKAKDVVPKIRYGGGTTLARGIEYFRKNYGKEAIFIIISDFEDDLEDWHNEEKIMSGYTMYGFNYGYHKYKQEFTNLKVMHFTDGRG